MGGGGVTEDEPTYGRCACVEAVFHELLDGRLQVNDDLAGGDAVDRVGIDCPDGGLAHVPSGFLCVADQTTGMAASLIIINTRLPGLRASDASSPSVVAVIAHDALPQRRSAHPHDAPRPP